MISQIIELLSLILHDLANASLNVAVHAPWLYVIACVGALLAISRA